MKSKKLSLTLRKSDFSLPPNPLFFPIQIPGCAQSEPLDPISPGYTVFVIRQPPEAHFPRSSNPLQLSGGLEDSDLRSGKLNPAAYMVKGESH